MNNLLVRHLHRFMPCNGCRCDTSAQWTKNSCEPDSIPNSTADSWTADTLGSTYCWPLPGRSRRRRKRMQRKFDCVDRFTDSARTLDDDISLGSSCDDFVTDARTCPVVAWGLQSSYNKAVSASPNLAANHSKAVSASPNLAANHSGDFPSSAGLCCPAVDFNDARKQNASLESFTDRASGQGDISESLMAEKTFTGNTWSTFCSSGMSINRGWTSSKKLTDLAAAETLNDSAVQPQQCCSVQEDCRAETCHLPTGSSTYQCDNIRPSDNLSNIEQSTFRSYQSGFQQRPSSPEIFNSMSTATEKRTHGRSPVNRSAKNIKPSAGTIETENNQLTLLKCSEGRSNRLAGNANDESCDRVKLPINGQVNCQVKSDISTKSVATSAYGIQPRAQLAPFGYCANCFHGFARDSDDSSCERVQYFFPKKWTSTDMNTKFNSLEIITISEDLQELNGRKSALKPTIRSSVVDKVELASCDTRRGILSSSRCAILCDALRSDLLMDRYLSKRNINESSHVSHRQRCAFVRDEQIKKILQRSVDGAVTFNAAADDLT